MAGFDSYGFSLERNNNMKEEIMTIKEQEQQLRQEWNQQESNQAFQEQQEIADGILDMLIEKHANEAEILYILELASSKATDVWRKKHLRKPLSQRSSDK